jgi:VWFA-related protein
MKPLSALPAILLAAFPLIPQETRPDELPTIKVDVDLVNILASVRDKNGGLVGNLTKDDFVVYEEGKEQEIKYFARETDLPLTIGLLVDVSGSQENLIEVEKQAAYQFLSSVLRKKDMAFLISFGSEAELLQDFTNSHTLLREGLDKLRVNSAVGGLHPGPVPTINQPRGTILHDAVYLAATDRLKGEVGRKVIVLITDGVDQGSRVELEEAIAAAHRADTVIYSIYYVDPGIYHRSGGFYHPSDSDLKKMSEQTGGRVFKVERKRGLPEIFAQIQEEMRSQYAIGYTPASGEKDGSFRRIEIKTKDKDYKVQARRGYFASKPESR